MVIVIVILTKIKLTMKIANLERLNTYEQMNRCSVAAYVCELQCARCLCVPRDLHRTVIVVEWTSTDVRWLPLSSTCICTWATNESRYEYACVYSYLLQCSAVQCCAHLYLPVNNDVVCTVVRSTYVTLSTNSGTYDATARHDCVNPSLRAILEQQIREIFVRVGTHTHSNVVYWTV